MAFNISKFYLIIFVVLCVNCSGYGIAAKALTAVIRAHDGRGQQTLLTNKILKALCLSSPDELIGYLF
jgi:N-acetylglucosamine kinase-like BadF-type ATPase